MAAQAMNQLMPSSNQDNNYSAVQCSLKSPSHECLEVVLNGPVLCLENMCSAIRRLSQDVTTGVNRKVVLDFSAVNEIASPWTPVVATLIKWADSVPFQCVVQGLHGQAVRVFELLRNNRNVAALLCGRPFGRLPKIQPTDQPADQSDEASELLSEPGLNKTPGTPLCVTCGYNLTGLTSARCPECGWGIDWDRAIYDEDTHRIGTPVHMCTEHPVLATLATVGLMLCRPLQFARRLRNDESAVPALVVALVCAVFTFSRELLNSVGYRPNTDWLLQYASTVGVFYLFASLTVLSIGNANQWHKRLRLFFIFSLYSTCFLAMWSLVSGLPSLNALLAFTGVQNSHPIGVQSSYRFRPCGGSRSRPAQPQFLIQLVVLAWWGAVFAIFWLARFPSQWRAVVYPAASILGIVVAVAFLGLALHCLP